MMGLIVVESIRSTVPYVRSVSVDIMEEGWRWRGIL